MSTRHEIESISAAWPPPLRAALLRCARGEVSANVALAQIFMAADDSAEAERALIQAAAVCRQRNLVESGRRLAAASALWQQHPSAFALVRSIIAVERGQADQERRRDVSDWAAIFDRLSVLSSDAGVAIYSLGAPELLASATDEIAAWIRSRGFLRPDRNLLDLGCGSGRFVRALAPETGFIVGIDISPGMIAAARRHANVGNAALILGSGRDLAPIADASIDLVYSVDAFPYLVEIGDLAARHVHDAARVLKPGGVLLILNYSYRSDTERDRAEIACLAAAARLQVLRNGTREFSLWDGLTFELQREP